MTKQPSVSTGLNFPLALTLIFITLRLCGRIAWSWWIVLMPLWVPIALLFAGLIVLCVVAGVAGLIDGIVASRKR